jgi:hypothetical protein
MSETCCVCGACGGRVCATCRADAFWQGMTDAEVVAIFEATDRDIAMGVRRIRNGKPPIPSWENRWGVEVH